MPPLGLVTLGNPMVDHMAAATAEEVALEGLVFGGECPEKYRTDPKGALAVLDRFKARAAAGGADSAAPPMHVVAGGAALNAARVAGWWLAAHGGDGARGGIFVGSIGAVGADANADVLRTACAAANVAPLFQVVTDPTLPAGCATGCSLVLTCSATGERSILGIPGAARGLRAEGVADVAGDTLATRATWLYATTFAITTPERVAAVKEAKAWLTRGNTHDTSPRKQFALNLSSAGLQGRECVRAATDELAPDVDMLFGNFSEAAAYCMARGLPADGDIEVMASLASRFAKATIIITNGREPTLTRVHGGAPEDAAPIQRHDVPPVPSNEIVDTNGAGDAFVGGLFAALLSGCELATAVAEGHRCAAMILRETGCVVPPVVRA